MCCIFTCCGWMIDLIQRLWTFTMSCCISSAVCCTLVTASMSGVALGYNYSLAEYIDLKETNVSVYLKRGVFDDDIADDMDWRRSGHMPVKGHINDENLITGPADDEQSSMRAGRRLDDSILNSNDKNSFEGALMKLTAKPPAERESSTHAEIKIHEALGQLPSQHMQIDELKAIQSAINMQKAAEAERRAPQQQISQESGRRMLPRVSMLPPFVTTPSNSLRLAVPDQGFHNPNNWRAAKHQSYIPPDLFDYGERLTLPTPITAKPTPIRPSRPKPRPQTPSTFKPIPTTKRTVRVEEAMTKDFDQVLDKIDRNLLLDKFDDPSFRDEEIAHKMKKGPNQSEEDYEDDIKGIPIRRKRNIRQNKITKSKSNVEDTLLYKLYSSSLIDLNEINISKSTVHDNTKIVNTIQKFNISRSTLLKLLSSCTSS
ncbi:unnamed protein product [Pieris macdunnoughi]|uniref:Uncharacterized protein n=1 Tax=Pieris macdunnoughi TaxID=345717 RepID=A0A821X174_9NEOP|nr:unnamed protein product [Pieris macdunnoughi]